MCVRTNVMCQKGQTPSYTTSTAKVKVHEKGTLVMHNRHARDKQCHRRCASMQLQVGRDFGLALEPKNYAPH